MLLLILSVLIPVRKLSLQDLNEESQSVLILPLWFRLFVSECFRSFGEPEASLFRM